MYDFMKQIEENRNDKLANIEFSYDLFLRPIKYDLKFEIGMAHVLSDMYEEGSQKDLAFIETILTRYGYSENAYNTAFKRRVSVATYKWYFDRSMGYLLARVLIENNCVNEFVEHCLKNYEPVIKKSLTNYKNMTNGKLPQKTASKLLRLFEIDEDDKIFEFLFGNNYPDAMVASFLIHAYILKSVKEEDTRDDYIFDKEGKRYIGILDIISLEYEIDCNTDEKWLGFENRIREKIACKIGCKAKELDACFIRNSFEDDMVDCIYWAQLSNSFCPRSWTMGDKAISDSDLKTVHQQIRNAITYHLIKKLENKYDGELPKYMHFNKYDFDDTEIEKIIDLTRILVYVTLSDNVVQDMLLKSSIQKHTLNSSIIADELERLKGEYRKVISHNETLKKQNNDLNNKILNRANKEKKGIEKPLLDEIKMLQEEIQKQKEEIAQLKQARESQEELLREVTSEHTLIENEKIDFSKIEVTRFLLVGGRDKITKQVLAKTKFKKIIKDAFAGTVDLSEVEYVIFFFDAMNHALYYKIINLVREQKKKVIYCHGNNIDKIFEQIYSQMK